VSVVSEVERKAPTDHNSTSGGKITRDGDLWLRLEDAATAGEMGGIVVKDAGLMPVTTEDPPFC
jgi:hypothetical protein